MEFPFFKKEKIAQKRSMVFVNNNNWEEVICSGYRSLAQCPEVITACRKISDMISTMTICLMANEKNGDKRIYNELSRKIDIQPNNDMTRKTFMDFVVMNMLLYGDGNSIVVPVTRDGYLDNLVPISASRCSYMTNKDSYKVYIDGKAYNPNDVLHFVWNPDATYPWKGQGIRVAVKDLVESLSQANDTKKGFMQSKWKPSLIVKVDALVDEFSSKEGRKKLLNDYLENSEAGEPWMIPAEQFQVEQVRPLSLNDLAINETVTLDKKTVASILGVPSFVLGVGEYNKDEWNAFINNTIRPIAREIEQEMTRKLILSPKMYLRFNMGSLYSYDLQTTASVYSELFVRGIVKGNEVREKIGLEPLDGLDELVILENYIPLNKIGEQAKIGGQNG